MTNPQPIVVAMSGGVDSSVTAALMKEQGHNVIGVTLQLYDHGVAVGKKGACCAGQDIQDARQVADRLGIPHYVLNYESRFKQSVMHEFADSYLRGETPIPCVQCNQTVKFRDLLQVAKDLGAEWMATGHYVQRAEQGGKAQMLRGADPNKDQSYFLFATTQEQLNFLRFPLGGMSKAQTRAHAQRFGLAVAEKPDSQDICFVPNGNYVGVIEKMRPGALDPGDIVHVDGRVIGRHEGIIHYTIGQRRGIGIGGEVDPLYVVKLDAVKKQVIVGPKEALLRDTLSLRQCNWLDEDVEGREVTVKLRSTHPGARAHIHLSHNGTAQVKLLEPQGGIAPGQACVAYDGERMLGGGWIVA